MVKKYLLFVSERYYPTGFDDYCGSYDTIEDCRTAADKDIKEDGGCFDGFYVIVEHETMKVVDRKEKETTWEHGEWVQGDWEEISKL